MSLNMAKTRLKKPYHVPIAWVKEYGEGKVMHMSLGHREDVWTNQKYRQSLLGGIKWMLGLEPGKAEPNPELSAPKKPRPRPITTRPKTSDHRRDDNEPCRTCALLAAAMLLAAAGCQRAAPPVVQVARRGGDRRQADRDGGDRHLLLRGLHGGR